MRETAKKNLVSSCARYSHENHIINMISCSVPSHNYHLYFWKNVLRSPIIANPTLWNSRAKPCTFRAQTAQRHNIVPWFQYVYLQLCPGSTTTHYITDAQCAETIKPHTAHSASVGVVYNSATMYIAVLPTLPIPPTPPLYWLFDVLLLWFDCAYKYVHRTGRKKPFNKLQYSFFGWQPYTKLCQYSVNSIQA